MRELEIRNLSFALAVARVRFRDMKTKRVIGVLVMLLLPLLCWFVGQSGKPAKPRAMKISSVNGIPRTITAPK